MKINIRRGVFETNSSHEHSISIVKEDDWNKWLAGKVMGRVVNKHEEDGWGNFWSQFFEWEFSEDFDKCRKENASRIEKYKKINLKKLEEYKNECLNYKKLVEKELTDEEYDALSKKQQDKYDDDVYTDSLYVFDEDSYNYWKKIYEEVSVDNTEHLSLVLDGLWMTYEQYKKSWLDCDCISPYDHSNTELGIHIFGKYFHS